MKRLAKVAMTVIWWYLAPVIVMAVLGMWLWA